MVKKKKRTKKKVEEVTDRSTFWPLAWAIVLFVVAVFVLIGGFGTGGSLPQGLFDAAYWTFGWGAYLTPVALIYYGIHKFASEDKKVPLNKFIGMLALLAMFVSWLHVAFVVLDPATNKLVGGHGGEVGRLVGGTVLNVVDKMPASLLFFVFTILAFFWAFNISPRVILSLLGLFRRKKDDTDLGDLKAKAVQSGFKLNEGVPVEHQSDRDRVRPSTIKNTAQKLSSKEDHAALTAASDPDWKFPGLDLLNHKVDKANAGDVEGSAHTIKETFTNFGIDVEMEGATVGPTVTQYTLKPPTNVKLTKLTALENNLALSLAAQSLRMEAPIPGKRAVGIEVPNVKPAIVRISSLLQSEAWTEKTGPLSFAVGKDVNGEALVGDLAEMPHLLIAGQTKSGKSIMINTLITSLIYRNTPSDMKLILVDPKVVELAPYNDIPHLLAPVITEPEKCISALKWAVAEMERRYRTMAEAKCRNINEYNAQKREEGMPYIVIIIDELADLMMMAARDVEALIVRIAQKARAVGLHLVLATQSPRVDVITGLIKANIPARVAFAVAGQIESRIIIDSMGAEKLLGKGDMLYKTTDMPRPKRVQGAFISTEETQKVTDFLRMQRPPQYNDEVVSQPVQLNGRGGMVTDYGGSDSNDDMWQDAVRVIVDARKASTSLLQRRLSIGYARAAKLIDAMEEQGIVGPASGARPREVLVSSLDEVFNRGDTTKDDVYNENFPEDAA